jgi:hypothetical protein
LEPRRTLPDYTSNALVRSYEHPEPVERHNYIAAGSARLDKSKYINVLSLLTFKWSLVCRTISQIDPLH